MSAPEDSVPVDDDEYVLRLIHPVYYKASLPLPIQPEAFRPTARDTTGLSVFRLRFATPQDALLVVAEAKRPLYYVSRLSVRDLLRLGLRVTPDPIAVAPGHALMPELNTHDYQADKVAWKEVQRQLAELASRDIVLGPAK